MSERKWRVIARPQDGEGMALILAIAHGEVYEWGILPLHDDQGIAQFRTRDEARKALQYAKSPDANPQIVLDWTQWRISVVEEMDLPRELRVFEGDITPGDRFDDSRGNRVEVKYVNTTHVVYWELAGGGSDLSKCLEASRDVFAQQFKYVSEDDAAPRVQ